MLMPANRFVRAKVGEFEVDLRCREVRHNGDTIKLQGNPCQILAELLQRPGEVVTREEIRQKLWPSDTFVDFEHGINTAVNKVRQAFGDDAENPRFIETLPRVGYRFIARVDVVEANGTGSELGMQSLSYPRGRPPARYLQKRRNVTAVAGALIALLATAALALFSPSFSGRHTDEPRKLWVQITDFADSATSPAWSPDGRMMAFIRGPETFVTPGQIYVKMLPDGQPIQLTHDDSAKMAPAFSPDGSRIAYTATDANFGWNTWVVPVLGGEPQELLPNAAALTWADREHVVFSEIKTGIHMGIATATESRAGERDVYLPTDPLGMAHRSWVSPDGKWILISEMSKVGWAPCRVLPFDRRSSGETAGPKAAHCTYAGWSPDGKMMYFSADAWDGYHIWRQRFPGGVPEQMTFGPTEEEGIAVAPDGQTLVTSAGIRESTVWLHDAQGDRQISGEGFASVPGLGFGGSNIRSAFSPDGRRLFYLVRKRFSRAYFSGELWMKDLDSDRTEAVLPGVSMSKFAIAPDGELVAFAAPDLEGNSHVWLAPLDRRTSPKQLTSSVANNPSFGPGGDVYFVVREGDLESVYSVGPDETVPRKINLEPGSIPLGISPHGDWWLSGFTPVIARPAQGGSPIRICNSCGAGWGPGSEFLYLRFRDIGEMGGGRTIAIALPAGKDLPELPANGLKSAKDVKGLNVVAEIDMKGMSTFAPGPNPSIYAYVRTAVQRNLFSIPLK
jgi:DNA-binding winged helix-turn-helix (wHTH) protein